MPSLQNIAIQKKKRKKKKSFSYPVNRNKSVFKKEIDNVVNKLKV